MKLFEESERKENNNEEVMEEYVLGNREFTNYEKVLNFLIENDIELTDDQKKELYISLTENSKSPVDNGTFKNTYVNCMEHMLKYKYTTNKQSASWLNTIRHTTLTLREIYSIGSERYKIDNMSDEKISRMYKEAVKLAKDQNNDVSKYPKTLPEELTVKNLINPKAVNDYVNKYKSNDYAIRELDRRNNDLYSGKD